MSFHKLIGCPKTFFHTKQNDAAAPPTGTAVVGPSITVGPVGPVGPIGPVGPPVTLPPPTPCPMVLCQIGLTRYTTPGGCPRCLRCPDITCSCNWPGGVAVTEINVTGDTCQRCCHCITRVVPIGPVGPVIIGPVKTIDAAATPV